MGVQKHVTEFRIFKMGKKILVEFKEKSVKKKSYEFGKFGYKIELYTNRFLINSWKDLVNS